MERDRDVSGIIDLESNAWRSDPADRVGFIVDAAEYYRCLQEILPKAARSLWIIGWDFNPDIYLDPEHPNQTLGQFLRSLVDANEALEIRILVWAMGPVYSGKSLSLFSENTWSNHPRISLRFDSRHPLRGSHHQKIVVVDDTIAFLGGIDLTARRWDNARHDADNPLRAAPDGVAYDPVHDLQAAVTGPSAVAIGDLARKRWLRATRQAVRRVHCDNPLWPSNIEPALAGCQVALSLTEPGRSKRRSKKQAMRLTLDALRTARRHVYIETQYFAFFGVASCLAELLKKPDGPDVVIVLTRASHGLLEKIVMGGNRDRLIRRIKRADIHGRLRVMYPVVPRKDGTEQDVLVHSKLLIIDDRFVRIGSSNLNNRSEGMDTEADIGIEANDDGCRTSLASLRNRLLAEHLASTEEAVAKVIASTGSLIKAIDELNVQPRGLRDIGINLKGEVDPIWGTDIVDPASPARPWHRLRQGFDAVATRLLGIFV